MPLYAYECSVCGKTEERIESLSAPDSSPCTKKKCKGTLERTFAKTAPPQFRGRGFHATSYPNAAYKGS